jgi:heavy metal efflux system protein
MRGLTGIKELRSISRFGLPSVSVYFDEKLDVYFARRLVMERLPAAASMIPKGASRDDSRLDDARRDLSVPGR